MLEALRALEARVEELARCLRLRAAARRPGERERPVKYGSKRRIAYIYEGEDTVRLAPLVELPLPDWAREYLDQALGRGRWEATIDPARGLLEVVVPVDGLESRVRAVAVLETLALNLWEYEKALRRGGPGAGGD